jgi:T5SS/PEP-CTERM-associated repeat protein
MSLDNRTPETSSHLFFSETFLPGFLRLILVKTICLNSVGLQQIKAAADILWDVRAFGICLGVALLLTVRTEAGVRVDIDGYSVGASRSLFSRDNQNCDPTCPSGANLSFRGQTSANIECPDCVLKGEPGGDFAGQDVATVNASAKATLSESLSSTNQTITFTASGEAHLSVVPEAVPMELRFGSRLQADLIAAGEVTFTVVDKAETITIDKSISASGNGAGNVVLHGPAFTNIYAVEFESGEVVSDTLPRSVSLLPGHYVLKLDVRASASTNITARPAKSLLDASFKVTLSVTVPAGPDSEMHWKNSAGGNFGTASNWDPQKIPDLGSTTIFDLPGISSPLPVQAANNVVGKLFIRQMPAHFTGPLRVIGENEFSFALEEGGSLLLDGGAVFQTQDASIGNNGSQECSVTVSGNGTKWVGLTPGYLMIGNASPGKVLVEDDGELKTDAEVVIGNGAAGILQIENGGQMELNNDVRLKKGRLEVRGVSQVRSSIFTMGESSGSTTLTVGGDSGQGTVLVEGGGKITTPNCTIKKGSIQVTGTSEESSRLEINSHLAVGGDSGSGSILIENGGYIQTGTIRVGNTANTDSGVATISGFGTPSSGITPSALIAGGDIIVAGAGGTQVEAKDGGRFRTFGNLSIGAQFGVGKVIVHGKGADPSECVAGGETLIGSGIVPSELNVEDRGIFRGGGNLFIGANTGELGQAKVSGANSKLFVDGAALRIGSNGQGVLTIADNALVECTTAFVGQSSAFGSAGAPPAGTGTGNVLIQANSLFSDTEWHVKGDCHVGTDESGIVTLKGSLLGLATGGTGGATLKVDGNLYVGQYGIIDGIGTLSIGGGLFNDGFISPGLSPGTLVLNGKYAQSQTGAIRIEVAGLDAGKFDILQINGDAALAGRVELDFIQGFVPKPGDTVEFLKVSGKVTGTLDLVPQIIAADPAAARPALVVLAKMSITPDGKGSLMVTGVHPTVQLNATLDPGVDKKLNLSFVPVAGANHFIEFRDGLAAGSAWQQFPGAPHNSGIVSDRPAATGRFYRVRVEN